MAFDAEVMELTTETEKHYQEVEMEEEDEQVVGLERKTSSFAHGERPDSADSSTITTTNNSSSSSFSGDGERVTVENHGEHDDVNNGNVYLDVDQGSDSSDAESDDHESQSVDHLNVEKKVTKFEKGSSSEEHKGLLEIDEEVDVMEEEVDIEDVKDYKAKAMLENQETPDLLCPKCKSCITKVIVLKKKVLLRKKFVFKKKNPNIPKLLERPRGTDDIRSEDNPSSQSDGYIATPEPEQSLFYKCLYCFSIFKSTGVEGVNTQPKPPREDPSDFNCLPGLSIFKGKEPAVQIGVEGVNTQPKHPQEAPSDFNCLPGLSIFKGKEPVVEKEAKAYDSSEDLNDGEPVEHKNNSPGKARLTPFRTSSERPDTSTPDIGVVDTGNQGPSHEIYIPLLPENPMLGETPEEPLPIPVVEGRRPEILKSIVYGGLTEAITSLGVISSAAGSGASTLNILVLGLANLFGGLILLIHNLQELREEELIRETTEDNQTNGQEETRYKQLLGRRENFLLHATISILSFIITGLLPPVVYYFSFRELHNKDYTVASIFGASLICITLLALAKAHVRNPRGSYLKSVMYYAANAVSVSGITYVVGNVLNQFLEKYGWSDGSETPAGEMMISLMGRKAGGFGYSSSY